MPTARRSSDGPTIDASTSVTPAPVASATTLPNNHASSSISDPRDSPRRRRKSINHHHPFRIELLDVTPVSVSLLWSMRPPPLSAIPLEIINTQLRKRIKSKSNGGSGSGSSSPSHNTARATSVSPSPTTATAVAVSKARSASSRNNVTSPDRSTTPTKPAASTASAETPIARLTEGLVATRSLNRKVTKIRLRAPPSAATQARRSSNSSAPSDSNHNNQPEDETWPSDDGATAVEDEVGSGSEASDSGYEGDAHSVAGSMLSVFEDRVSVIVNGHDWPHVLMGDRGSHEAIVVIFGLEPESDYEVQFVVKGGGLEGGPVDALRASLRTRAAEAGSPGHKAQITTGVAAGSAAAVATAARPASPSPLSRTPVLAPDVAALAPKETPPQRRALLQAEVEASEALKASLIAEIKKARKEAAKAESGLKNDIEAVKKSMERLNTTDQRNKRRMGALQELIKQTTVHVQEIHDEAEETEKDQPNWETKELEAEEELERQRKEFAAEEAAAKAEWDKNEAAVEALETQLKLLEETAKKLEAERDELKNDKLPALHKEVEKLKEKVKEALNKPHPTSKRNGTGAPVGSGVGSGSGSGGGASGSQRGGHRHASNPVHVAPTPHILHKGKGTNSGGRGGKSANLGNRAVSGPAGQFGAPAHGGGPARGFMQNFGKGMRGHFGRGGNNLDPTAAGFTGMSGFGPGGPGILPGGSGYVAGGMHDPALNGIGGYPAPGPSGDTFYGLPPQDPAQFPSGVSEVSQDDLYDPTLGFDPYDPSPDARRRSSLPIPQIPFRHHQPPSSASNSTPSILNPANPEFVPSAGSTSASPVVAKNAAAAPAATSGATGSAPNIATTGAILPSIAAISTQSQQRPGAASVEHSPTSSSRFAFPLARHQPAAAGTTAGITVGAGKPINSTAAHGPGNVLSPTLASDLGLPATTSGTLGSGSSLFPIGPSGSASPFPRHSPLLAQGPATSSATSPMIFASNSPRFAPAHLGAIDNLGAASSGTVSGPAAVTDPGSAPGTFIGSRFGPLDYDPGMEGFGPAPGLATSSASTGGLGSFATNSLSSIFSANDTWAAPGAPGNTSLGSGSSIGSGSIPAGLGASAWSAPSPPLGGGGSASGDIWSAPALPGVTQLRNKMSLNDLGGAPLGFGLGGGIGGGRPGLGAIGQSSATRSSPLTSPITAPLQANSPFVSSASPTTAAPARPDVPRRGGSSSPDQSNLSPVEHQHEVAGEHPGLPTSPSA
ncbi:hypothetical protein BCV70DRAFT_196831 [Testicularia cyperi]|uniref:Uncharacterized protein n=1 Tax=Testicularia cyperi TaxID=1882483 RepID=A0A317XXD3_9BASI|nr:hypothetical protein BCV70DRAFT_196831 [Testicularia cyperi]